MRRLRRIAAISMLFVLCLLTGCSSSVRKLDIAPSDDDVLVVYTSHKEEVYGPIIKEFEACYGILVEVVNGGSATLLERIKSENQTGPADVMFGGGVDLLSAYSDCFESYEVKGAEFLSTPFRDENNKWTAFSSLPIVIIYNNKLVYVNSVPMGWADLLEEKWKGKIAFADPGKSGTSYTSLVTLLQVMSGMDNSECMQKFKDNLDGKILDGSGEVLDTVAAGTRLIGVTLEEAALKRQASGADISIVYPSEGTSAVPDGCAIVKGSTHLENAQTFLDFIVSYDVQLMLAETCSRRPVRSGIQINDERLKNAFKELEYDLKWAGEEQTRLLEEWNLGGRSDK